MLQLCINGERFALYRVSFMGDTLHLALSAALVGATTGSWQKIGDFLKGLSVRWRLCR